MKKAILNLGLLSAVMLLTSFSTDNIDQNLLSSTDTIYSRGAGQYIPPGDKPKLDITSYNVEEGELRSQIIPYQKVVL